MALRTWVILHGVLRFSLGTQPVWREEGRINGGPTRPIIDLIGPFLMACISLFYPLKAKCWPL